MINIDTRLLDEITPDQLYLLCHVVNFMNENRMCFPSNKKIIEGSGFSDSKVLRIKNELIAKKLISVKQRFRPDGSQTSNLYKIETNKIGVYVTGNKMSDLDPTPFIDEDGGVFTDEGGAPSRLKPLKVLTNLSINHLEVLNENVKFSETKLNPFEIVAKLQVEKESKESCEKEKKEKKPNQTYEAFIIFCQTFEDLSGAAYPTDQKGNYIMTSKDAGSIVYLMRFIDKVDRSGNWQDALKVFINAAWKLNDKWLKANFTPSILYSQSSKIFTAYQTSSPEAKKKASDDKLQRLLGDYIAKMEAEGHQV